MDGKGIGRKKRVINVRKEQRKGRKEVMDEDTKEITPR
jgi:hypothetical protein